MATRSSNLTQQNTDAATFRLWINEIHNSLIAFGWTQTADTGQINFATVAAPVGASNYPGYAIYAMADALQASYPCYLRIDFGSGAGGATTCSIKVQIGTGTNGAGTLTGNTVTQQTISNAGASSAISACFTSGTTSRFTMAFWPNATSTFGLFLNIERDLDSSGVNQNVGIGMRCGTTSGSVAQQFLPNAGLGAVPNAESKWLFFATQTNPAVGQNLTSIMPLRQAYGPLRNPEMGFMAVQNQIAIGASAELTRYSAANTYFLVNTNAFVAGNSAAGITFSLLMLWE